MESKPLLEFIHVTLRAVNGLAFPSTSWTFARNQNWAIVGRNGSGKTLLARALAGEVPVVKGEIRYHIRPPAGKIPEDCAGECKACGLPEHPHGHEDPRDRPLVPFGCKLHDKADVRRVKSPGPRPEEEEAESRWQENDARP